MPKENNNKPKFFKFEKKDVDFPFYKNNPKISTERWILLSISVIIPLILVFLPQYFGRAQNLLDLAIPFLIFGVIANWKYNLICKKIKKSDLKLILILLLLQIIFSLIISILLIFVLNLNITPNPASNEITSLIFWIIFPLQIFGEELLKIIPFIILLTLFYKLTENRKNSIIISTIIVLIMFGLIHMPAYNNIISVILLQGIGSIFGMYSYIKTKNILVSFILHLIFDIIAFSGDVIKLIT